MSRPAHSVMNGGAWCSRTRRIRRRTKGLVLVVFFAVIYTCLVSTTRFSSSARVLLRDSKCLGRPNENAVTVTPQRMRLQDAENLHEQLSTTDNTTTVHNVNDTIILNRYTDLFHPSLDTAFCVDWTTMNMDSWWTHNAHVWRVKNETDDTVCFEKHSSVEKIDFLTRLYELQFVHGNCSNVHTKFM